MQRTADAPEQPKPSFRALIPQWIGVRVATRSEDDLRLALESAVSRIP